MPVVSHFSTTYLIHWLDNLPTGTARLLLHPLKQSLLPAEIVQFPERCSQPILGSGGCLEPNTGSRWGPTSALSSCLITSLSLLMLLLWIQTWVLLAFSDPRVRCYFMCSSPSPSARDLRSSSIELLLRQPVLPCITARLCICHLLLNPFDQTQMSGRPWSQRLNQIRRSDSDNSGSPVFVDTV